MVLEEASWFSDSQIYKVFSAVDFHCFLYELMTTQVFTTQSRIPLHSSNEIVLFYLIMNRFPGIYLFICLFLGCSHLEF